MISIRYQINKLESCYVVAQTHRNDSENNPVLPDIQSRLSVMLVGPTCGGKTTIYVVWYKIILVKKISYGSEFQKIVQNSI